MGEQATVAERRKRDSSASPLPPGEAEHETSGIGLDGASYSAPPVDRYARLPSTIGVFGDSPPRTQQKRRLRSLRPGQRPHAYLQPLSEPPRVSRGVDELSPHLDVADSVLTYPSTRYRAFWAYASGSAPGGWIGPLAPMRVQGQAAPGAIFPALRMEHLEPLRTHISDGCTRMVAPDGYTALSSSQATPKPAPTS